MKKLDSRRNMGKGSKKPTLTRQKDISRYMTKDPLSMDDKKVTIVPILVSTNVHCYFVVSISSFSLK